MPTKSSWSSSATSICHRSRPHASPHRESARTPQPPQCSGDLGNPALDLTHFFLRVEKVGLGWPSLALDDLLRFRIERCDLALRLAERLVHHARSQQVEPGGYALGLLQGEAIEVAGADEVLDRGGALRIEAERFERLAPEDERGFEGFAQLKIDPLGDQLQGVAAVEGAHVELAAGELGMHQVDDVTRRLR